ncbi:MAG: nucleoside/nucleotide kinase family protein [Gaiellaceae bacterium]
MTRPELLELLAGLVLKREPPHPLRVAIDGPDAAGKTMLADELAELLADKRPVIRAGIDSFHNPRELRYRRGPDSPEGYFLDSFDYEALRTLLLEPLGPGGSRRYRRALFDYRVDEEAAAPEEEASPDAVLLFDGVFLLRSELAPHWDFSIFVHADFDEIVRRAEARDQELMGGVEVVRERYRNRYIPGQELYFSRCAPQEIADVAVDNSNPDEPQLIKR